MNALEPGSTLGGYRILARLRAGAMGVLYLARRVIGARQTGFSRPVAIKVIHDHLAQNKRFTRMFVDEAKLSARIDDPNVVRVEEFGMADGRFYLVMEYVDGASLAQTIGVLRKRGKIPIDHAVAIAIQIASGLHGAHEATDEEGSPLGIVHRDVSPHNILVSYRGSVRVIDFGIAKAKAVGGQTKTGSLRGKLAYMPPEQARSARTVDRRADLYGVGLVLWEMLTFRRVFDADTDIAILNQIRDPQILPPSSLVPGIPKALDAIVMRTLANDPDDRPATGAALQRALAEAMPSALNVLAGDLATLMNKVRAAADAASGSDDAAASLYGEELKRTLATFAGSMSEQVDVANAALGPNASSPELDPPPSSTPAAPSSRPASTKKPSPAVEEERTERLQGPSRPPSAHAFRPSDGVRPIVPTASGSSPDVLIPPPPLSSARALVAPAVRRGSLSDSPLRGSLSDAPRPSSPDLGRQGPSSDNGVRSADDPPLATRQKVILAVLAPAIAGVIIALTLLVSGSSGSRGTTQPSPPTADAAAPAPPRPAEAPTLIAPVVIAPPVPVDENDAGAPAEASSARGNKKRR